MGTRESEKSEATTERRLSRDERQLARHRDDPVAVEHAAAADAHEGAAAEHEERAAALAEERQPDSERGGIPDPQGPAR
jgi:hypothetical protein